MESSLDLQKDLQKRILNAVDELHETVKSIERCSMDCVSSDERYRREKAEKYLNATGKTIPEKEAQVEIAIADARRVAHTYEAKLQSLREKRKAYELTIQVYQTILSMNYLGQEF